MVCEPPDPTLLGRVDELHVAKTGLAPIEKRAETVTHLILLEHHEVEMLDPLFSIISHPFFHGRRTKDVPNVFINKCIPIGREEKTHVGAGSIVDRDKGTNLDKFSAARSPKPFFSVKTMSIGAYCLRWNLETVRRRDFESRG